MIHRDDFEHDFDNEECEHLIGIPHSNNKDNNIGKYHLELPVCKKLALLHELTHAWLFENVHPLFGGGFPIGNNYGTRKLYVDCCLSCAQDWFVEDKIFSIAGNIRKDCWKDEAKEVRSAANEADSRDYRHIIQAGFILAVSEKYMGKGHDLLCIKNIDTNKVAAIFQSTSCQQPSLSVLTELLEKLICVIKPCKVTINKSVLNVAFTNYNVSDSAGK